MVLVALATAYAADCPAHPSPERLHARLEALVEPVAFADDSVAGELDEVLTLLDRGCVQGVVPREDVVTAHLLRGSYAILAQGDEASGDAYLRWATQWGPPDSSDFGPAVTERINALDGWSFGEVDITFEWEPSQIVLDGEVIYDQGVREVVDGYHLVQWRIDDGWFGVGIVVGPGQRVHVGTGSPTGGSPRPIDIVPVEEPDPDPEGSLRVQLGYSLVSARASDGQNTYGGTLGVPSVALVGRYGRTVGASAGLRGGPPPGPGRAPLGTEARVGPSLAGEGWQLDAFALGGLLPSAIAPQSGSAAKPWFQAGMAWGGGVRGTLGFGPASGTVGYGRLGPATTLELEVLIEIPLGDLTLVLSPRGHALQNGTDRYVGAGVQVGLGFGL
jgi:hypothetical protein